MLYHPLALFIYYLAFIRIGANHQFVIETLNNYWMFAFLGFALVFHLTQFGINAEINSNVLMPSLLMSIFAIGMTYLMAS